MQNPFAGKVCAILAQVLVTGEEKLVCNPVTPKVLHVPDWHALAACPFCRQKRPVSHYELKELRLPIDGSAELICRMCERVRGLEPRT